MKQSSLKFSAVLVGFAAMAAQAQTMNKEEVERYCAPGKNNDTQAVCCARMVNAYIDGLDVIPGATPKNGAITKEQIIELRKKKTPECDIKKKVLSSAAR
jgi:hypothetical protein